MNPYRKAARLLMGVLLAYILLVGNHLGHLRAVWPQHESRHELGEFWPFSIYPMFSRGGHPWARPHLRVVQVPFDSLLWLPRAVDELRGTPYALDQRRIDQNDIAEFLTKTHTWSASRIAGIRSVFEGDLSDTALLIYRAEGTIHGDSVSVVYTPFMMMAPDTTYFNPHLNYASESGAAP